MTVVDGRVLAWDARYGSVVGIVTVFMSVIPNSPRGAEAPVGKAIEAVDKAGTVVRISVDTIKMTSTHSHDRLGGTQNGRLKKRAGE